MFNITPEAVDFLDKDSYDTLIFKFLEHHLCIRNNEYCTYYGCCTYGINIATTSNALTVVPIAEISGITHKKNSEQYSFLTPCFFCLIHSDNHSDNYSD